MSDRPLAGLDPGSHRVQPDPSSGLGWGVRSSCNRRKGVRTCQQFDTPRSQRQDSCKGNEPKSKSIEQAGGLSEPAHHAPDMSGPTALGGSPREGIPPGNSCPAARMVKPQFPKAESFSAVRLNSNQTEPGGPGS
jgi:hypothetical protein